ncbi:MAG: glycosyltransferase [Bacteroidetes bacterium]|nr:glycosyltransferase [Bacteroidota bacterium]
MPNITLSFFIEKITPIIFDYTDFLCLSLPITNVKRIIKFLLMNLFYLLTYIVCLAYAALMISYFIGWNKTLAVKPETLNLKPETRVSVIIPVRNEEKNIQNILHHLSKQDYQKDKYEIIAVDDFSEDKTIELIQAANISNLKLIRLISGGGKKQAINEGIKNASGTLIITTDADCEMGEKWLSAIVAFYEEHKPKMIVAPVLLSQESGVRSQEKKSKLQTPNSQLPTFSEIIQSQEMTVLTASACASLYCNSPVLCSGANLAYEKDAFNDVNGFDNIDKTATGDDVFLMLKIHKQFPNTIKYLKSNDAVVFTHPEKEISSAFSQRKRWASKTFFYGFSHVTGIAILIFMMNFLVLLSGILSVINVKFAYALITALPIKCIVDFMLLQSASSFFGKRTYPVSFFLASVLYPVYVSVIGLISPFTNYSWKGRQS